MAMMMMLLKLGIGPQGTYDDVKQGFKSGHLQPHINLNQAGFTVK
jgi:hypothetical protein